MKKTDEKAINEVMADIKGSLSEEHSLQTTPMDTALASPGAFKGIDIEGLESISVSMVSVPFCRVIQPTSKKTTLKNGKEATAGNFMFNDIQEETGKLNFVLLRAKYEMVKVDESGNYAMSDYEGETREKPIVKLLGITLDTDKLFILTITSTSFSNWGRLLAQMKGIQLDKSYRMGITATTEKRENKKGKYYVVIFQLEKELSKEQFENASKTALEYNVVLDKQIVPEE